MPAISVIGLILFELVGFVVMLAFVMPVVAEGPLGGRGLVRTSLWVLFGSVFVAGVAVLPPIYQSVESYLRFQHAFAVWDFPAAAVAALLVLFLGRDEDPPERCIKLGTHGLVGPALIGMAYLLVTATIFLAK